MLRGGREFLARHRPVLSVEYGRPSYSAYGHTADTLYEEAAITGYAVCDLFGNVFRSIDEWRLRRPTVLGLFADSSGASEATAVARADIARRAAAAGSTSATVEARPTPARAGNGHRAASQTPCLIRM